MKQLVLDTNVLVSGMISPHGAPGRIIDLLREGTLELVLDDRILDEYCRVLNRPYFSRYFSSAEKDDIICYLETCTYRINASEVLTSLPDPDDAPFAETALSADVPLVTGNARHFPKRACRGLAVLSPRKFLEELAS